MHDMNDMLHTYKTHQNWLTWIYFMNVPSSLFKKNRICVVINNWIGFFFLKKKTYLILRTKKKSGILMKEKSNLFLRVKKLVFLMKGKSNLLLRTKKIGFLWKINQICFVIYIKKKSDLYIKKIKSVFICVNNIKKKIILRRGLYSWNKSMLHALNKQIKSLMTPFFISKSAMLKKQI